MTSDQCQEKFCPLYLAITEIMNSSNEIDQSELSLLLKFKELSQLYFHLSMKSSLSDDELDLIDSILERAQDNRTLSDLISSRDRELHEKTQPPDTGIVDSLRNQAFQILQIHGFLSNNISEITSQLTNLALLRANGVSNSQLKYIYNLGFYSGVDLSFDLVSGNLDSDLEQKLESFDNGRLDKRSINFPFFLEEPTFDKIEISNSPREQFIDQIIDLYSPGDECAHLVRDYFYISSSSVVSETQSDRIEEILDQSQTDPILRSFLGEIDRWILEGANLMNPKRRKEYESQKLELKTFVQSQPLPLNAAIDYHLPPVFISSVDRENNLVKLDQMRRHTKPPWENPLRQIGTSVWTKMTDVLSNPKLLGTVCLTTMTGAFVSLLFLNSKCFSAFFNQDYSAGQGAAISFLSSGNVLPTDHQNRSTSDKVLSLERDRSWQDSSTSSTMITFSSPSQVYALVSALESGQSLSENRQLSSEWKQKSAEARQLMAESYQKLAETQQLLASTKQFEAEDKQQQTKAEFWLTKAQEWRNLSARWADQAVIEESQAQTYLRESQHYLSRARQYSSATDSARSAGAKLVSTHEETPPHLNPQIARFEERDPSWTSFYDVLLAGNLVVAAISAIGVGVSIGARKSQQTSR
jgi:hypothetical protein